MVAADDGFADNRPDDGQGGAVESIEQGRPGAGATELGPDGPTSEGPRGPLSGLLVADFSRILAGPYASMLLADLGAEVVKVESPSGDDTRTWMPPVRDGVSTYYLGINRNKRSIALDLAAPSRTPRWPASWPPGPTSCWRTSARRAGPLRARLRHGGGRQPGRRSTPRSPASAPAAAPSLPGYDLIVQAISGLMSLTGDRPAASRTGPASRSST